MLTAAERLADRLLSAQAAHVNERIVELGREVRQLEDKHKDDVVALLDLVRVRTGLEVPRDVRRVEEGGLVKLVWPVDGSS
ncbi:MAG: hypothetical protein M9894_16065 [Planctomycetes bacterium]|nr:hypothetical protein [Planctomycetota bacterium]